MSIFDRMREEEKKKSSSIFDRIRSDKRAEYLPELEAARQTIPNLQEMTSSLNKKTSTPIETVTKSSPTRTLQTPLQQLEKRKIDTTNKFMPTPSNSNQVLMGQPTLSADAQYNRDRQQWVEDRLQTDRDNTANSPLRSVNTALEPLSRIVYDLTSRSPVSSFQRKSAEAQGINPDSIGAAPAKGGIGDVIGGLIGTVAGTFANPGNSLTGVGRATLEVGQGIAQAAAKNAPRLGNRAANIANNRYTQSAIEGAATGAIEGAYATALQRGDGKDLATNVLLGAGIGAAADTALTGIGDLARNIVSKYRGKSADEVKQLLALPAPRQRGNVNTASTNDVITPEYTFGLPDASPQTANRLNNYDEGLREISEIDNEIRLLQSSYEKAINDEYNWLRQSLNERGGVRQGSINFNTDGDVTARTGRQSDNPFWYRQFYAEHGKVPNRKELYELAKKRVDEGFQDETDIVPGWKQQNAYDETIQTLSEVRNTLRQSIAELNPNLNLTDAKLSDNVLSFDNTPKQNRVEPITQKIEQVETPTKQDEIAATVPEEEYKQSWWQKLFGNQGIGATAGRTSDKNLIDMHIVDRQVKSAPLIDKLKDGVETAEQNFIDQFAPFKDLSPTTYQKAMDTTRANNLATLAVKRNMVDLEGNVIGESLADVYSGVPRGQKFLADRYLILRNSVNRMERDKSVWGKEEWFPQTADEASVMVSEMEQRHPWIKGFGSKWDKYVRNLQDMYVSSGIASKDLVSMLREMYPHYAPTIRQVDETKRLRGRIGGAKQSMSNQTANIKKAKGGTGKIVDPAQSMIDNTARTYNAMLRNRVVQDIYKIGLDNPESYSDFFEIVPKSAKVRSEMLEEVNKRLADDDLDGLTDYINEKFEEAKLAFSDSSSKKGQAKIVTLIDGEPFEMIIKNASLLKAIDGVSPNQIKGVLKVIDSLSRAVKQSATGVLAPLQGAKLAIRDLPIALVQSKDKANFIAKDLPMAFISQMADWLPDFVPVPQSITRLAEQYRNAGGGYEAFLRGDSKVRATSKSLVKDPILSSRNVLKSTGRLLLSPFTASKAIGDAFENIPRIAAFNNEMRRNGWKTDEESIRKALNESREITVNWSRRGAKGQDIEALLPYSNAAIQGSYRFFKRLKEQPISALALISTIAGAKIASYEMFKDDVDYQNRSKFEKGIPIGKTKDGKFITIPVEPTEAFVADQIVDFYKFAMRQDKRNLKTTGKERVQNAAEAFLPTFASGPISAFTQEGKGVDIPAAFNAVTSGSALEPVSALVSGQNFYGGDIVPYDHQDLPTNLQHNETTSAPAKWAAENLGISGFMFDYLGQKLGGDFAKIGLPMTSEVGRSDIGGNILAETATRLKLLEDPVMKNRISNDYYNLSDKVKQAKAAEAKDVPLPDWYQDVYDVVTSTKNGSVASDIADLNKQKKLIQIDVSLSAKERADKLRDIQTQINMYRLEGIEIMQKLGVE